MGRIKVLGLICARGGSKGLHDKHLLPIAGRAVIEHACEYVLGEECDAVVLSSDDDRILEAGNNYVDVLRRPACLAKDNTPITDVVRYIAGQFPQYRYIMHYDGNWVCRPPLLNDCRKLMSPGVDLVQPLSPIQKEYPQWCLYCEDGKVTHYAEDYTPGRHGLEPVYYPHNGAFLIRSTALLKHTGDTWPEENKVGFVCEPGIDIDNERDYLLAKAVMEQRCGTATVG